MAFIETDFPPVNLTPVVETNALVHHSTVDANNMHAAFAAVSNSCCPLVCCFEIHPVRITFAWPTMDKHDVLYKIRNT